MSSLGGPTFKKMNGNDSDIYRHLATAYTKENWFCDPFCPRHFVDWVTEISDLVRLKISAQLKTGIISHKNFEFEFV